MSEYYWKTNEVCFAVLQDAYKCNFVHQFYRKTMASFTFLSIHLKGDRTQLKQSTRDKNYLTDGEKGRRCNNNFSAKKNLLTLFQFLVLSGTNKKLFVLSGTKKKTSTETETHKRNIVFMSSSQPVPVSPFIFPTVRWRVEEMRRSERWKELHQKSTKWYSFSEFVCLTGEGGEGGGEAVLYFCFLTPSTLPKKKKKSKT